MFDLASGIERLKAQWKKMNARQEVIKEDRRLIDREKLMIDPTSIVLIDDFFEYAVKPAVESHSAFSSVFKDGSGIQNATNYLASVGYAHVFTLPVSNLEDEAKDRAVKLITARVEEMEREFQDQEEASKRFFENMLGCDVQIVSLGGVVGQSRQEAIEHMMDSSVAFACYVQDLAMAMDMHRRSFFGNLVGVEKYEEKGLKQNEGAHVLAFWKSVNDLKDYSGFFPNKPPPRGNKPDDRDGRVKVGEGKLAFNI